MARYSSDSDSDRSSKHRSRKYHRRSRSSSSDSSDTSPYRKRSSKHSKSRRHKRSRTKSRERSSKTYKSSRANSRDRRRYKSPERTKKKIARSKSPSKEKCTRSQSREKSTSRSSSSQSCVKSTADKSVNILAKDEFSIEPRISETIIDDINSAGFTPKQFTSSSRNREKKNNKNIVIDISGDTIQVPPISKPSTTISDSIFHTSIMMDQEARFDRWVKKLYNLRQKVIAELSTNLA